MRHRNKLLAVLIGLALITGIACDAGNAKPGKTDQPAPVVDAAVPSGIATPPPNNYFKGLAFYWGVYNINTPGLVPLVGANVTMHIYSTVAPGAKMDPTVIDPYTNVEVASPDILLGLKPTGGFGVQFGPANTSLIFEVNAQVTQAAQLVCYAMKDGVPIPGIHDEKVHSESGAAVLLVRCIVPAGA